MRVNIFADILIQNSKMNCDRTFSTRFSVVFAFESDSPSSSSVISIKFRPCSEGKNDEDDDDGASVPDNATGEDSDEVDKDDADGDNDDEV